MPSLAGAAAEAVDVILRDGGTLRLRPPTSADSAALVAFFGDLSAERAWKKASTAPASSFVGGRSRRVPPSRRMTSTASTAAPARLGNGQFLRGSGQLVSDG